MNPIHQQTPQYIDNIQATLSRLLFQMQNDKTLDPKYLAAEFRNLSDFLLVQTQPK
jgi:hypothetical protein